MSVNVRLNVEDYKSKRIRNGNCKATNMAIAGLSTIEIVQFYVSVVADSFKDRQFIIEYDGYYSIVVKCDDIIIYDGNVVDVENMLQEGIFEVRDWVWNKLIEVR